MAIIYSIFRLIFLPGTYIRFFLEHTVCRASGIKNESREFFRLGEQFGHAEHEPAGSVLKNALLTAIPGLIHLITGVILTVSGISALALLGIRPFDSTKMFAVYVVFLYLGVSMLVNLFPSVEDALFGMEYIKKSENKACRILLTVPAYVALAGAYIEKYCINIVIIVGAAAAMFFLY